MSLINQVLRDLDQRHAEAPVGSPAIRTTPLASARPLRRCGRWCAGIALSALAVVGGGMAQGHLTWPAKALSAAVTPPAAPVVVAAPVIAAVPRPLAADEPAEALPSLPEPTVSAAAPSPAVALAAVSTLLLKPSSHLNFVPPSEPAPADIHTSPVPVAPRPAAAASPVAATGAHAESRIDKRSLNRTPLERAEAAYQRAVAAHQQGLLNESADGFAAALKEEPRFFAARQAQAGLLISQSRFDEAQALLQQGLALDAQQPALALMQARLSAERQDLPAAVQTLKAALPAAAADAEYLGFYAAILQRANRHAEASVQFGAALQLVPAHSLWWMGLGISLAAEGQNAPAREAFNRAKLSGALPPDAAAYVDLRLRQLL